MEQQIDLKSMNKQNYLAIFRELPISYIDSDGTFKSRKHDITDLFVSISKEGRQGKEVLKNERVDFVSRGSFYPNKHLASEPIGKLTDACRIALILGISGIGKTVLAKQIVVGWANETIYHGFMHCRLLEASFLNRCQDVKDVKELFPSLPDDGEGVLFVIDALDEVKNLDSEKCIIYQLLDESDGLFGKSKFIIMGRPYVKHRITERFSNVSIHELNHLSEDDIKAYINIYSNGDDKIAGIIYGTMNKSPAVASLLGIPKYLSVLCNIAVLISGREILNITEFYCWVLFLFFKEHGKQDLKDSEVFSYHSKIIKLLGKMMYNLLKEEKVIVKKEIFNAEIEELEKLSPQVFDAFFVEMDGELSKSYQLRSKQIQVFLAAIYCHTMHVKNVDLIENEYFEIITFISGFHGCYLKMSDEEDDYDVCKLLVDSVKNEGDREYKDESGSFMIGLLDDIMNYMKGKNRELPYVRSEKALLFLNEYLKPNCQYENHTMLRSIISKLISLGSASNGHMELKTWLVQVQFLNLVRIADTIKELGLFHRIKLRLYPLHCFELCEFFKHFEEANVIIHKDASLNDMEKVIENISFCNSLDVFNERFDCKLAAERLKESHTQRLKEITIGGKDCELKQWNEACELFLLAESVVLSEWKIGMEEWQSLVGALEMMKKERELNVEEIEFNDSFLDRNLAEMLQRAGSEGMMSMPSPSEITRSYLSSLAVGSKPRELYEVKYARIPDVEKLVDWYNSTKEVRKKRQSETESFEEYVQKKPYPDGASQAEPMEMEYVEQENIPAFIPWTTKLSIGPDGGTLESELVNLSLIIPPYALESVVDVEFGRVEPSSAPNIYCTLGEAVVSDIVEVRPAGIRFKQPAILTIPHSVAENPNLCRLAIKRFDEERLEWVTVPFSPDDDPNTTGNMYAVARIQQTSVYALCCVLDTFTQSIPKSGAVVTPFHAKYGVKVVFEEDTFEEEDVEIEFKMNTFTTSQIENFKSVGLNPTIALHITAANGAKPRKNVTITLPFRGEVQGDKKVLLLSGDGDNFEDITSETDYEVGNNCVVLKVSHFSVEEAFETISTPFWSIVKYLKSFTKSSCNVTFHSYGKGLRLNDVLYKVCCCDTYKWKEMNDVMEKCDYKPLDFAQKKLESGAVMRVRMQGGYCLRHGVADLEFISNEIQSTQGFEICFVQDVQEQNWIVIFREGEQIEIAKIPFFAPSQEPNQSVIPISQVPPVINIHDGITVIGTYAPQTGEIPELL